MCCLWRYWGREYCRWNRRPAHRRAGARRGWTRHWCMRLKFCRCHSRRSLSVGRRRSLSSRKQPCFARSNRLCRYSFPRDGACQILARWRHLPSTADYHLKRVHSGGYDLLFSFWSIEYKWIDAIHQPDFSTRRWKGRDSGLRHRDRIWHERNRGCGLYADACWTAPANVSLTPSASAITDQQSVSIAVTVSGSSGQAVPTGSLSLIVGTFTTQVELKDGAVTLNIPSSAFRAGANSVTVTYSGDMVYSMEKATTTITVSPVVISPPSPLSISAGGSATAKLALSAGSTYSGTLHLTCAMTSSPAAAQNLPTCSLNPTSVAIAPKGTGSATFTVQTIGTSPAASLDIDVFGGSLRWIGGAALAGVILLGLPDRRRWRLWMISLVAIAGATGLFGCDGSTASPTVSSTPQTTAGNYAFSVTRRTHPTLKSRS